MITLANIRRSVYNLFKRVEGIEEFLFQFTTDWTDFKEEGIVANQAFPETWHKTGVLNNLIQDINADDAATTGKVYTATVSFNDLPSNMLQAELKVEIKEDSGKVILFTLISNETSPYYWLGISSYSGEVAWKSFLTEHQDISGKANSSDLAIVATTGDFNDLINTPSVLDGKSAYELAVDNGFEGTEQEWLASLKGPQGILGETGPQGVQGIQGIQGEKGDKGDKGDQGIQGEQGPQGVLGPKGADGTMTFEDLTEEQRESLRGPLGIQGPAGKDGSDGVNGQDGAPGLDGHSPVITASKSGSTTTIYVDGTSIATIEDGLDGQDGQNGTNGLDGVTPHIDSTSKHWMIGSTDTGIVAEGQNGSNGTNGSDGVTPHIDSTTGNWFVGTTDTGVHAQGPAGLDGSNGTNGSDGQDGHTPVITASKSNGVTTVSVDGSVIATINDGQDGSNGTNGTNGTDGNDGTDGITPTVTITSISNGHNVAFNYGTGDNRNIDFDVMDGDVANQLQADWNQTNSSYADYIKNKPTLFSGSYNDLTDKPTIPSAPDLTNYVQKSSTSGLLKNDGTVDTNTYLTSHLSLTDYVLKSLTSGLLKNDGTVDTNTYLTSHLDISGKANSADLATVATSGSYADLSNKPIVDRVHITKDTQLSTSSLYIPNVALNSSGDYELNVSSLIKYDLITQLNNGQTQCSQADFAFGAPAAYSPDGYPCGASFTLYNQSGFSSSFYSGATSRQVFWFNEGGRVLTSENCGDYSVAKVWRGTQAQYDAITNPDNNTIYIITSAS